MYNSTVRAYVQFNSEVQTSVQFGTLVRDISSTFCLSAELLLLPAASFSVPISNIKLHVYH